MQVKRCDATVRISFTSISPGHARAQSVYIYAHIYFSTNMDQPTKHIASGHPFRFVRCIDGQRADPMAPIPMRRQPRGLDAHFKYYFLTDYRLDPERSTDDSWYFVQLNAPDASKKPVFSMDPFTLCVYWTSTHSIYPNINYIDRYAEDFLVDLEHLGAAIGAGVV